MYFKKRNSKVLFKQNRKKNRYTDKETGKAEKKGKKREGEERPSCVDHDAVLEWNRQAATLHANEISQLKRPLCPNGLVAPESQGFALSSPTAEGGHDWPRHTSIYRKQLTPWFPSKHPSFFSAPHWLPSSVHSAISLSLSWFLLGCSRYVCSFPGSHNVFCALCLSCLSLYTEN